jgi:hypothetical protein
LEIAVGERVVVHGVVEGDTERFWLRLFAGVDTVDGLSPEV